MSRVEHSITVDVPVRVAYDQWTQFESFPHFMEGVERVIQHDDQTVEWWAAVAGRRIRWTSKILEQVPDKRVSWVSTSGALNAGLVRFRPAGSGRTRIDLRIEADPSGFIERTGDSLGFLDRRVQGDLERFKSFIEGRHGPTGAWRGEIHDGRVYPSPHDRRTATNGS
jgi:uncharacterized membrane protein